MKSIVYTMSALAVTGAVFAMTGCASNEVLTKPEPNNNAYNPSAHTFYDADPHKDRYVPPLPAPYFVNGEGEFVKNPDYNPKN